MKLPRRCAIAGAVAWFLLATWPAAAVHAGNVDPNSYAWGENIGWLSASGLNVGAAGVTGYMWGENVGWVSFSCANDASCGSTSYGVTRDAAGHLAGYAWGENIGWVSLSCQNTGSCADNSFGVTVDPVTGTFSGFAWGENVGWISFSCADTASCSSTPFGVQQALYDVAIQKTATPQVAEGGTVDYTLVVVNNGPGTAFNLTVSDPLPTGVVFQSLVAPAGWACTTPAPGANGTVSCTIPTLPVSSPQTFVIGTILLGGAAEQPNTATVSTDPTDQNPDNDSSTAQTRVGAIPLLSPAGRMVFVLLLGWIGYAIARRAISG
jgi:uncharacterized repeat protein (TIGR01451 family)